MCLFLCDPAYLGDDDADRRESLLDGRNVFQNELLHFGGDVFRGLQMWDQERRSGGPFLPLRQRRTVFQIIAVKFVSKWHKFRLLGSLLFLGLEFGSPWGFVPRMQENT